MQWLYTFLLHFIQPLRNALSFLLEDSLERFYMGQDVGIAKVRGSMKGTTLGLGNHGKDDGRI